MTEVYSRNALPTSGYLIMTITFKIAEAKRLGYKRNQTFETTGNSKVFDNVRANTQKMKTNAIYNGVKQKFPNGTVTPSNVLILSYNYVYYLDRYNITERKGKYYEKYRDREKKRTRYYRTDTHLIEPYQEKVFD